MTLPALTNQVASDIPNMGKLLTLKGTSVADASTSGTGEDTLASITLTAGDVGTTGVLKIFAAGYSTGMNGSKSVKLHFGADSWPVVVTNVAGRWEIEATIMLSAAAVERVYIQGRYGCYGTGSGYTKVVNIYDTAAVSTASNVTIKTTGECLSASDSITSTMFYAQQIQLGS